jgi:hypothetical protein
MDSVDKDVESLAMSDDAKFPPEHILPSDIEGLEKACECFPPLGQLILDLASIKESKEPRSNVDEMLKPLLRFLPHIPFKHRNGVPNDLPLRTMTDLMLALHDLNEGKNPPLFRREPNRQAPNRNTKTGEGLAYDYIIAARHYLMESQNHSEKEAESFIAKKLQSAGVSWITQNNINSVQRGHNRESRRSSKRVDARNSSIDSTQDLDVILARIAHLLKTNKTD